eukprot:m.161414 g.161414  ORF g.161414 m.161414 type:complete len:694 (+) comp31233_c0_seq1:132-2213(+)
MFLQNKTQPGIGSGASPSESSPFGYAQPKSAPFVTTPLATPGVQQQQNQTKNQTKKPALHTGVAYCGVAHIGTWNTPKPPSGANSIKMVKLCTAWDSDASRSLLNQGHVIFQDMQRLRDEAKDPSNIDPRESVRICAKYRSALQSCAMDTSALISASSTPDQKLAQEYTEFLKMDALWHLCEIFFVRKPFMLKTGGLVLQDLLEWVVQHCSEPITSAQAILQSAATFPDNDPEYWPTIVKLLFQGQIKNVANLLSLHSRYVKAPENAFEKMRHLLLKMPMLSPESSSTQFYRAWDQWQHECRQWLEGHFDSEQDLQKICRLLSGDIDILEKYKDYAQTWYQLLVARLLFTNPLAKFFSLDDDILWAQQTMDVDPASEKDFFPKLLNSVFQQDALQLVRDSCFAFEFNWWFPSHIADVLLACGCCPTLLTSQGNRRGDFRTRLVLDFAESILSESSMFSVAPAYFISCGEYGVACLEQYLEKIPLNSNKMSLKVLGICKKYGLENLEHRVCRILGRRAVDCGQISTSLAWFHRAKDGVSVSKLADRLLIQLKKNKGGRTGAEDIGQMLDIFRPAVQLSDRLAFLATYSDFLKMVRKGKLEQAGDRLVTILDTPKMASRWFWIDLLLDALPLLENPHVVVFNDTQTCILMRCLEDVSTSHHCDGYVGNDRADQLEELRLALARNFARTIMLNVHA